MGVDSDLTGDSYTHTVHMRTRLVLPRPIVRDDANHVIFRATPLLWTVTPSRVRHSPVPIAPSRQRDSLQSSPSDPSVAHKARRKMASKPLRGESRKSPLRRVSNADQLALRTRFWPQHGAREWSTSRQSKGAAASSTCSLHEPPVARKPGLHTKPESTGSRRHPLATAPDKTKSSPELAVMHGFKIRLDSRTHAPRVGATVKTALR